MVRHIGGREFSEGTTRLWRVDFFEVEARFEFDPSTKTNERHEEPKGNDNVEVSRSRGRDEGEVYPVVRLDPAEHVEHLWVTEDEVRTGWCGGVELVFTDPAWGDIMLRAFELHRAECGC